MALVRATGAVDTCRGTRGPAEASLGNLIFQMGQCFVIYIPRESTQLGMWVMLSYMLLPSCTDQCLCDNLNGGSSMYDNITHVLTFTFSPHHTKLTHTLPPSLPPSLCSGSQPGATQVWKYVTLGLYIYIYICISDFLCLLNRIVICLTC